MVPHHHADQFLPKQKVFFPHDITLIASVVGESAVSRPNNGIGGIITPPKNGATS